MNIWILNHYADTPDRQTTRSYDLGKQLVARGHAVTVFAAGFNHYSRKEERIRPGETHREEDCNGVRFIWLKTFPYQGNDWRRILNMVSYSWQAFRIGSRLAEAPDTIIGVSVHPLAGLAASLLARKKRSRFFFEVTDLWPETLIAMGKLSRNGIPARMLRALEKHLYHRAEKIIMLLGHTEEYVAGLGESPGKIVWVPNGADLSRFASLPEYDGKLSERFTIMYVGGIVRSNRIDVILRAAAIQQSRGHHHVRFIFVGDGSDKENLVKMAAQLSLENVEFRGLVPKTEVVRVMAEADAFVFSLADLPLYKYGISLNKMCDYLASGRPILFAGDSTYNPIREAGAGIYVPAENPAALADAVDCLIALTPEERVRMGRNGLEYFKKHHDIRVLAERLEQTLKSHPASTAIRSSKALVSDLKSLS
ncbi:MAG: glycosyltransferase family 4 protein [Candidatus Acidiferrales bacterium]